MDDMMDDMPDFDDFGELGSIWKNFEGPPLGDIGVQLQHSLDDPVSEVDVFLAVAAASDEGENGGQFFPVENDVHLRPDSECPSAELDILLSIAAASDEGEIYGGQSFPAPVENDVHLRPDPECPSSELVVLLSFVAARDETDGEKSTVFDPTATTGLENEDNFLPGDNMASTSVPPPQQPTVEKRKRGRPRKNVEKTVPPKKPKKYQKDEDPTDKSIQNAKNARKNRELRKAREEQLKAENALLKAENAQQADQIMELLVKDLQSQAQINRMQVQIDKYGRNLRDISGNDENPGENRDGRI
ncbi:bZIP transcription factor 8 [Folsomia candida]|uniref:BZIP transcription factor 8 n=2 Tax=Folsomia candida TaxID=158441 RepID=A0A226DYS3_FOLCA|nr:bZIP transcription factor 8 [Folsomia candida]